MHVLVLKHVETEGPGVLEAFLESHGVDVVTLELFDSAQLPDSPRKAAAVVSMDGPMGVHEESRYPFLRDERSLLQESVRFGVPVLGICLGAQLLAEACGAKVRGTELGEIGFSHVRLTPDGLKDPLFRGFDPAFEVFGRREDTFGLPQGSVLLAEGDGCRNQAFRYGSNAYGLQFRVEVTPKMVGDWFEGRPERTEALRTFSRIANRLKRMEHVFCLNFLGKIIRSAAAVREMGPEV